MTTEAPGMRDRIAAQSVIEELLRQQQALPPRSRFARFWGRSPLAADSVAWYLGAQGEIAVGQILSRLPPEWRVFHALPIGTAGADIDHLVLGPGGVFTINTKHHRGKKIWIKDTGFLVNGHRHGYIRNSEFEATRVTKLLRKRMPQLARARPVIALVSPGKITIKKRPVEVTVIDAVKLRRWLLKQPVALAEAELVELSAAVDSPATWSAVTATPTPTPNLMAQFTGVDGVVRAARGRRILITLLGIVTVAALGIVVVLPNYEDWILGIIAIL